MRLAEDHKHGSQDGPTTAEQNQQWCAHIVGFCIKSCTKAEWLDDIETVHVTCNWAGLGGMPIGLSYLAKELSLHSDVSSLNLKFHSFTDYDQCCQGNN